MTNRSVEIGDVVLVPLSSNGFIPGKVLYVSSVFKNVILLVLYDEIVTEESMPSLSGSIPAIHLYTSEALILKGELIRVGNIQLLESERGRAMRIVGDSVWLDDEKLRVATASDRGELPKMGVCGLDWILEDAEGIASRLNNV